MTWYSWKRPEVESVRVHGRIHVVSPAIAASVGGRLKGEKGSGACSEFEGKECSAGWRTQSAAGKRRVNACLFENACQCHCMPRALLTPLHPRSRHSVHTMHISSAVHPGRGHSAAAGGVSTRLRHA
jgi:hypothetical protein